MKNKISHRIFFVFTITTTLIFTFFLIFIKTVVEPANINFSKNEAFSLSQAKSSEIGAWIESKANEFRVLSEVPAFKSIDLRGIEPLIENLTLSYMEDDQIMERFAYGGVNEYSGFNWVNADAILDLILYEDYSRIIDNNLEYGISDPLYANDSREVVLFYYPITGYSGNIDGLFCGAIPMVRINSIVNTTKISNGKSWIMDQEGHVFTADKTYLDLSYVDTDKIAQDIKNESGSIDVLNVNDEYCTLFYSTIENTNDWIFCTLVKNSELSGSVRDITNWLWFIYLLLLFTAFVSANYLSKNIDKPIKLLQDKMYMIEQGDMHAYYDDHTLEEIDHLGASYNSMLTKINDLIVQKEIEETKKRQAELSVLQSQIKPHFLYNTLDNIKWLAIKEGNKNIAKIITNLSTFFRISLSNGEEQIPITSEISHTTAYLEIQRIRYPNQFDYEVDVNEEFRDFIVPKLLIQPLVENCIYHGIKNCDWDAMIYIRVKKVGIHLVIEVEDTGKGMTDDELAKLRSYIEKGKDSGHYGLGNISERLHYTYGKKSFMKVESSLNKGTIVYLFIPIDEEGKTCID